MASSKAATVPEYLAELPADRRKEISAARALVRKHMPKGYKETMGYGMITLTIPLSTYTNTYNKQPLCYAALAAQKNCKKFDMGKSCLHFKRFDDLVPEAVATVVASTTPAAYIKAYEASRRTPAKRR